MAKFIYGSVNIKHVVSICFVIGTTINTYNIWWAIQEPSVCPQDNRAMEN